jgi:hypothetical protein
MDMPIVDTSSTRYAKCIAASKKVRWDIDRDVIRGRQFDLARKFVPDGLARIERFAFATPTEKRFISQIQGRTYANMFGLVERYIGAKLLEVTRQHALGDQVIFESLVRFTDEELKHQELFRRLEEMMAAVMPPATSSCRSRTRSRAPSFPRARGPFSGSPAISSSSRSTTTARASTRTRRSRSSGRTSSSST